MSSWRESSPRRSGSTWKPRLSTARLESASGRGPAPIREVNQTWSWRAQVMCRPLRLWLPWICCVSTSRTSRFACVNVVDLMTLQPPSEHPHGISDLDFDSMFSTDKPVIFAYHGYPWLIHRLTYRRRNHDNLHVRGYKEEGTTTTPFDMTVMNQIDRFHLAGDVVDRVPRLQRVGAHFKEFLRDKLVDHKQYVHEHGDDMPEIQNWTWPY